MKRTRLATLFGLLAAIAAAAAPAWGQGEPTAAGTISGSVVDERSGVAVVGASVVLQPESQGALGARAGGGVAFSATRAALSDRGGHYAFDGLPPGRYRLHVIRPGYRTTWVVVELRGATASRVWVGLEVDPIALEPVAVRQPSQPPFWRARYVELELASGTRVTATPSLQPAPPLSVDARELVRSDVVEAVTLGEVDLFRAVQRMVGVSTRDDYAAELWMRGAPWDQTRIYFDGVPLYDPLHGAGAFSGVSANAVGAAWLHPGVRSAALGDGAAGVLDLRSRRGSGDGGLNGLADLSVVSSGVSLDQTLADGRGAWMLSARRTYLDWLTLAVEKIGWKEDFEIPYAFWDVTSRLDYRLDERRAIEVSGLVERDRVDGDIRNVLVGNTALWGNIAGRATLVSPLLAWESRHTVGATRYSARVRDRTRGIDGVSGGLAPSDAEQDFLQGPTFDPHTDPPARTHLDVIFLRGALERGDDDARWRLGYEASRQSTEYDGPPPGAYPGVDPLDRAASGASLAMGAFWIEHRAPLAEGLTVEAGLRLEVSDSLANGGPLRTSPRLSARYEPGGVALSASAGRVYQYAQAIGLLGPRFGPFYASRVWLLAGPEVPALRSDIATVGAETILGDRWQVGATAYYRRATGVTATDPEPGTFGADRPVFVPAENRARGIELSVRRLVGTWTTSLGYTFGHSELEAAGYTYPAPQDRRHTLDATAMVRLTPSLRLGGALTAATGAPFTRRFGGPLVGDSAQGEAPPIVVESPNAQRTPDYLSLDMLLDWTGRIGGSEVGAYLQLRNVLDHDNAITYRGSRGPGCAVQVCGFDGEVTDEFDTGIPRLPVIGFRLRF